MKALMLAAAAGLASAPAIADTIFADSIVEYFDSGAGPIAGPYGGTFTPANYPVPVPLTNATDQDGNTFVSLPTGSFLTLAFSGGSVIDGPGNDIFISEPGEGFEVADVFVSSGLNGPFTLLGQAFGDQLTELDLADIGFAGLVRSVKIVGLDSGGGSPGFDVAYVEGLEGSIVPQVPLPAGLPLMVAGLGLLWAGRGRR